MDDPLILTTSKNGHYRAYGAFLREAMLRVQPGRTVTVKEQGSGQEILAASFLVLIDGDGEHLALLPQIILRSLRKRPTMLLSVRTEDLLSRRFKSRFKRVICRVLKALPACELLSIHKGDGEEALRPYVGRFIYDFQYWDLRYLFPGELAPAECAGLDPDGAPICIVPGGLNYKRNPRELKEFVGANPGMRFIIAGLSEKAAVDLLAGYGNVLLINRYISDAELMWLYGVATAVWAVYPEDVRRPSGVFGRAVQFGRFVFIREQGFLHRHSGRYPLAIPLREFAAPRALDRNRIEQRGLAESSDFNDWPELRGLLAAALG